MFCCSRPGVSVPHDLVSRPPSYRSRASDAPVPIHGRHPSQLSYLSTHSVVVEAAVEEAPRKGRQIQNPGSSPEPARQCGVGKYGAIRYNNEGQVAEETEITG